MESLRPREKVGRVSGLGFRVQGIRYGNANFGGRKKLRRGLGMSLMDPSSRRILVSKDSEEEP